MTTKSTNMFYLRKTTIKHTNGTSVFYTYYCSKTGLSGMVQALSRNDAQIIITQLFPNAEFWR